MANSNSQKNHLNLAKQMLSQGHRPENIAVQLKARGLKENELQEAVNFINDLKKVKRTKLGMILLTLGIIAWCISFVSSQYLFLNGPGYAVGMYGFTSLGIMLFLVGTGLVFGF